MDSWQLLYKGRKREFCEIPVIASDKSSSASNML